MYQILIKNQTINPTDAQVVYFRQASNSISAQSRVPIPINGTIRKIRLVFSNTGTLGSNETSSVYLNLNGATNQTLLTSSVTNDTTCTTYLIEGLSIAVTTSDYINIQWTCPTRATNPTNVNFNAQVTIY